MKKCTKCLEIKTLNEFYPDKVTGYRYYCKPCCKLDAVSWQRNNINRVVKRNFLWKQNNKEKVKLYRANGKETDAAWRKLNRDSINKRDADRKAATLQATPSWTNHVAIGEFYALAALKTKLTGNRWTVDHIVPLVSKLVCGLHTHYNLRVVTNEDNASKGNRHWPDMP